MKSTSHFMLLIVAPNQRPDHPLKSASICENLSKFLSKLRLDEKTGDQKKALFLKVIDKLIVYKKFFKEFITHKKKTNRVVVFSYRCFPNILKFLNIATTH